jgi:two-component system LytT family response regulator
MKILICDDEQSSIDIIIKLLKNISKQRKLLFDIKSYNSGDEVCLDNTNYDIAFIDIEMPGINGLTVTKHIKAINSNTIIFIVTSFQSYLDDAMALNVFRYLSKPIDENRFIKNINIAIDLYQKSTQNIVIDTYDECYNVFTRDILYVTLENRKACVVTSNCRLLPKQNFDYWKKQLSNYDYFAQSHYSFIVNLKNVTHFSKNEITLSSKGKDFPHIPISRRYYTSFKNAFYNYIGVTI